MKPEDPILRISKLTVRRDIAILRRIDWTFRRGEHWVVLGPNGCGKTSLLAALTGYLTPTSGEIELLGESYGRSDWRELRKRVGFVSNALTRQIEPMETALEVVSSGPSAVLNTWKPASPAVRAGALALLRSWQCGPLADRLWGVLSQGERQRALIARALLAKPPLVLLDEPCAGLDPVARRRLLSGIERQARRRRGPGLVLITHHIEEITPAFTHVLLIRRGRVVESGPVEEVLNSRNLSATFGRDVRVRRTKNPRTFSLTIP